MLKLPSREGFTENMALPKCASAAAVFLLMLAVNALSLIRRASGFAYLEMPLSRNYVDIARAQYCPQCLNGPGICGDPVAGTNFVKFEYPSLSYKLPHENTLQSGKEFEVKAKIITNLMGHMELFLCEEKDISQCGGISFECIKPLYRVPKKGEMSPYDFKYPGRLYLPPSQCLSSGYISAWYRMPYGVKCDRCVLRWLYETGNSCNFDGYKEYYTTQTNLTKTGGDQICGDLSKWWNPIVGICDRGMKFANCADIRVRPGRLVMDGNW